MEPMGGVRGEPGNDPEGKRPLDAIWHEESARRERKRKKREREGGANRPDATRDRQAGVKEVTTLGSHWVRACTTSFTSMVPITIFSLLTVSWAAPVGRASRVSRTRLPLVSVLPANLR